MKEKYNLKVLLILMSLVTFSCVQDDPCSKIDTIVSSDALSAEDAAKCDDGGGDNPDDGTDPLDPIDPAPIPIPDPTPIPVPSETDLNSLNKPWSREDATIVIDAYQGNSIDWDKMATDTKVAGVIHRSSIGMRVDTKYKSRKKIALDRGYLWGAYHLGRRGDTIKQADLFLSLVQDEPDTLMILDLEDTNSGNFMSITEAITFMDYIYEKTGKIPTVYANHSTTKILNERVKSHPLFQQSKLWYARFKSKVTDYPSGVWPNYFLWQFSSEINCSKTGSCLYNVPGTRFDMDVNIFNGPQSDLRLKWNND
jgi:GH25 family lysozyme M1 (1,4-beta-N-acetylmuramidase)